MDINVAATRLGCGGRHHHHTGTGVSARTSRVTPAYKN